MHFARNRFRLPTHKVWIHKVHQTPGCISRRWSSGAPIDQHDDSKIFPWRLSRSPIRPIGPPHVPGTSPLATYIINPIKRELISFFARTFVHQAYGEFYIEYQFMIGASYALERFCTVLTALSKPGSSRDTDEVFRSMLTRPLYDRLSKAISNVKSKAQQVSLNFHLHDARITDMKVQFGPEIGTAARPRLIRMSGIARYYELGQDHYLFKGFSLGAVFSKEDVATRHMTPYQLSVEAMEEGAIVQLEVTFDAEVTYRHVRLKAEQDSRNQSTEGIGLAAKQNDPSQQAADLASRVTEDLTSDLVEDVISSESCRREIVVLFEGQHFTQEEGHEGRALSARHWRIADIDFLLESDRYLDYVHHEDDD
ncbi:uncharacterized protein SPPG_05430 [Spizellomyces punctatus DAOM BR117]|uniref:Uncharacterized protein n=1 Tax=Spizellomyces punctatus (strain DAOM BR117) TaxID=645134 RepID=A0A0L0HDT3_SPIPD|nr:uncharacterized protein SPPG_05430 [Spizellomyces punctatus DAOM BR117]KNC99176.1 hypothetical protein SPPG_05430 [Spizellomyces punctatus DAOM BR117]|eukprot:XP_016607216.1 hypothetical protein SPPG_05430 [Spizellomyces punctatus DAOM BR117]